MSKTPEERYREWRTTALIVWAIIGIIILVAVALWGLGRIAAALVPFVMAFVIVFLLNIPVRELEKRGLSRGVAALICIVVAIAVLGGIVTLLGPAVAHQVQSFGQAAPKYLVQAQRAETAFENRVSSMVLPPWLAASISEASLQLGQFMVTLGDGAARVALNAGKGLAAALLDIFLSIVVAFWVLTDLPQLRDEIVRVAGPSRREDVQHLMRTVTRVVGGYLRGQSIASLTTATISTIGLTIFHVPYALVLGIIAFFFNFAP